MYNKLYTYVHEIFLSTTIVTSNLTILLDFFTIMWKGKGKNDRELEVFDGDSRDLACSEHEENTMTQRRYKI